MATQNIACLFSLTFPLQGECGNAGGARDADYADVGSSVWLMLVYTHVVSILG